MAAVPVPAASPAAPPVAYDVFCRADLRIGTILYATSVAGSRQGLCQITVEVEGWGIGVAMSKIPGVASAVLVGKLAVVACNIQPKTIAGVLTTLLLVTVRTPDQTQSSILIPDAPFIVSGCLVR
jgi:tRNA-binding EMAP/Myf-like protein